MNITHVLDRLIRSREFSKRLGHQPRLQTHVGIAHVPLQFRTGHKRRDRVHHHRVECAAAHERVGDFQCLFPGIGLGNEQIFQVDPYPFGELYIQRVLRIHKSARTARPLRLRDDVQGQCGFAGSFGTVNFDDAAARHPTRAKRDIECERARWNHLDGHPPSFFSTEPHDGPLAKLLFDL